MTDIMIQEPSEVDTATSVDTDNAPIETIQHATQSPTDDTNDTAQDAVIEEADGDTSPEASVEVITDDTTQDATLSPAIPDEVVDEDDTIADAAPPMAEPETADITADAPEALVPSAPEAPADAEPSLDPLPDDDSYNPSLALRVFTAIRTAFIRIFDVLLTALAVVIERIAALNWASYGRHLRDSILSIYDIVFRRVPIGRFKLVYGVIALILIVVSVIVGARLIVSSNDGNRVTDTQTVNISQTNSSSASNGNLSPIFTPTVHHWERDIARWTDRTEITPNMLATLMQLESCGNAALNTGLFGISDAGTADQQAQAAITRLQTAMRATDGDFAMALAVYADGDNVLTQDFDLWSFHARDLFILGRNMQQQIGRGEVTSPDLNAWLQHSGGLLCTEAQSTRNE